MLDRFKAVFFDVGGTLLRVHPSVGHVYAEHARPHGFEGTPEDLNRRFRQAWQDKGGMEALGRQKGPLVERRFWRDLVFDVFQPLGGLDRFDAYFDHIYDVFRGKESWRVYEDVTESGLLDRLKKNGVRLGVISNWDSRLPEILANMDLAPYFDVILASTVVGSAKPDRFIFEEALRRTGVAPNEACHIGDEPATDIAGAQNAGLDAILIDRADHHPDFNAAKISSFVELG